MLKRLLVIALAAVVVMGCGGAWGATVTITPDGSVSKDGVLPGTDVIVFDDGGNVVFGPGFDQTDTGRDVKLGGNVSNAAYENTRGLMGLFSSQAAGLKFDFGNYNMSLTNLATSAAPMHGVMYGGGSPFAGQLLTSGTGGNITVVNSGTGYASGVSIYADMADGAKVNLGNLAITSGLGSSADGMFVNGAVNGAIALKNVTVKSAGGAGNSGGVHGVDFSGNVGATGSVSVGDISATSGDVTGTGNNSGGAIGFSAGDLLNEGTIAFGTITVASGSSAEGSTGRVGGVDIDGISATSELVLGDVAAVSGAAAKGAAGEARGISLNGGVDGVLTAGAVTAISGDSKTGSAGASGVRLNGSGVDSVLTFGDVTAQSGKASAATQVGGGARGIYTNAALNGDLIAGNIVAVSGDTADQNSGNAIGVDLSNGSAGNVTVGGITVASGNSNISSGNATGIVANGVAADKELKVGGAVIVASGNGEAPLDPTGSGRAEGARITGTIAGKAIFAGDVSATTGEIDGGANVRAININAATMAATGALVTQGLSADNSKASGGGAFGLDAGTLDIAADAVKINGPVSVVSNADGAATGIQAGSLAGFDVMGNITATGGVNAAGIRTVTGAGVINIKKNALISATKAGEDAFGIDLAVKAGSSVAFDTDTAYDQKLIANNVETVSVAGTSGTVTLASGSNFYNTDTLNVAKGASLALRSANVFQSGAKDADVFAVNATIDGGLDIGATEQNFNNATFGEGSALTVAASGGAVGNLVVANTLAAEKQVEVNLVGAAYNFVGKQIVTAAAADDAVLARFDSPLYDLVANDDGTVTVGAVVDQARAAADFFGFSTSNMVNGGNLFNQVVLDTSTDEAVSAAMMSAFGKIRNLDSSYKAYNALSQLHGDYAAYADVALREAGRNHWNIIRNRLDFYMPACGYVEPACSPSAFGMGAMSAPAGFINPNRIWVGGFGDWSKQDNKDNLSGYKYDGYGAVLGYDHVFGNLTLGLSGQYTRGKTEINDLWTTYDADVMNLDLYASYLTSANVFFRAGIGYGKAWNDYDVTQYIGGWKKGDFDTSAFNGNLEVGYLWRLGMANIVPSVGLDYTYMKRDGWNESAYAGAVANRFDGDHRNYVDIPVRVRINHTWMLSDCAYIAPEIRGGVIFAAGDREPSINAGYVGANGMTKVTGVNPGSTRWLVGAGVKAQLARNVDVRLDYDYTGASKYYRHNLSATLGIGF